MNIPANLLYAESHEWITQDDIITLGITEHAQEELTDIVYVELPEVGSTYEAGDEVATVESVKTASPIYAPIEGEVVEINSALEDEPGKINSSPYVEGWLVKIKPLDGVNTSKLMTAEAYGEHIS